MDFNETPIESEDEKAPDLLVIGEVQRPHGVKGEVRVRVLTDVPERFQSLDWVYLGSALDRVGVEGPEGDGGKDDVVARLARLLDVAGQRPGDGRDQLLP